MLKPIQRLAPLAAMAAMAAMLAGCAGLAGPRQVELPLNKLQAGVERRFPLQHKVLELFDIELTRPQLSLTQDGRVALGLDALLAPPFIGKTWRGSMALSGRLYIDGARNAVMMAEPQVQRFAIDGISHAQQHQLVKVANVLVGQIATDVPVYQFRLGDLKYAGVQFMPTRITTTPTALVVTLEPVK